MAYLIGYFGKRTGHTELSSLSSFLSSLADREGALGHLSQPGGSGECRGGGNRAHAGGATGVHTVSD